jgi:hypothetical protein
MIDADVWREAHEYHSEQLRLHQLALHGTGIVQGLVVRAVGTENELVIEAGLAIDPTGRCIVIDEPQRFSIRSARPGLVYLVARFREIPAGPLQTTRDGREEPRWMQAGFLLQERDHLPDEPYVELARIDFDPARGPVANAGDPSQPLPNELDLRSRPVLDGASSLILVGAPEAVRPPQALPERTPIRARVAPLPPDAASPGPSGASAAPSEVVAVAPLRFALAAHSSAGWDGHQEGLRYLAREVGPATGRAAESVGPADLADAGGVDVLYFTGYAALALSDEAAAAVSGVVERGGVVIGDGCAHGPRGEAGAREFARSFDELAGRVRLRLLRVERNHALLVSRYVFGAAPLGSRDTAQVLEGGGMVLCDADYGCAWAGGPPEKALPRAAIRDALEFGVNLTAYRRGS